MPVNSPLSCRAAQAADDQRLQVRHAHRRFRLALVDDRLRRGAGTEAGQAAEGGLDVHLHRAVGRNARRDFHFHARLPEIGRADVAPLLSLRELLVGDFLDHRELGGLVIEHGDVRISQQPGVSAFLQCLHDRGQVEVLAEVHERESRRRFRPAPPASA